MATETPNIILVTKRITRSFANSTSGAVEALYICPPDTVATVRLVWRSAGSLMTAWSGGTEYLTGTPSIPIALTANATIEKEITLVSGQAISKLGASGAAYAHGYDIAIEERTIEM